jgi:3-hydroxyacyl-CoA dehydrogenase
MTETAGIVCVGIVGAGIKGAEIATYALAGGYRVMLEDISTVRLSQAEAHIAAAMQASVAGDRFDSARRWEIDVHFSTSASIDEVSRTADLLIEAAPEDAELQLEIFTIFDKFAKPHTILASTASTIPIADLAEMTNCPERCVGLRFPEPGASDRVLRIIGAPKTSERTLQTCAEFARALGFAPEIVGEAAPAPAVREARTS